MPEFFERAVFGDVVVWHLIAGAIALGVVLMILNRISRRNLGKKLSQHNRR